VHPKNRDHPMHQTESREPQPMMLIHEICRLMGDRIREKGGAEPIGQRSGRLIMMELSREDGRTQLDLVNATHLKAPTVSVALQKLESEGYVERVPDEKDMRAMRVYLTAKGRALEDSLRSRIIEEETAATSVLTEAECETLCCLLLKIRGNILHDMKKENTIENEE